MTLRAAQCAVGTTRAPSDSACYIAPNTQASERSNHMATTTLSARVRTDVGKGAARKLRSAKQVPGVIYGHNRQPQALALDERELEHMLERVAAETTVVEL